MISEMPILWRARPLEMYCHALFTMTQKYLWVLLILYYSAPQGFLKWLEVQFESLKYGDFLSKCTIEWTEYWKISFESSDFWIFWSHSARAWQCTKNGTSDFKKSLLCGVIWLKVLRKEGFWKRMKQHKDGKECSFTRDRSYKCLNHSLSGYQFLSLVSSKYEWFCHWVEDQNSDCISEDCFSSLC